MRYLFGHWDVVAPALYEHFALVGCALTIACCIAFPLAIACTRTPLGPTILFILNALYTIPSLALLALLIPLLGIGFRTAICSLVVYAQMILVRNIVAGLTSTPAAQCEAARSLGMRPLTIFFRVELPFALPLILAGIRIATVALIAMAALAGWIGAGGLGRLIFDGIRTSNYDKIIGGSILCAALAILASLFCQWFEKRALAYIR